ncbi:unnamed protein product [Phyllotreta striolata]|uniref:Uncharacterized protein n=1 Tax=Phyllotreta striolata TaxID=444603 RepID=A0A9N9TL72_PHYSR|nr:unnamed protein product [Phyllotreta striolata]
MNPFVSNGTNYIDESFFTSAPVYVNGQNVLVSQEKNRKLLDTVRTAIVGNFQFPYNNNALNPPSLYNGNYIRADKHFFPPSGVLFTFPTTHRHSFGNAPQPHYFNVQDQSALGWGREPSELAQTGVHFPGFDYQQLSRNPFYYDQSGHPAHKLRFHLDTTTSCSDLLGDNTPIHGAQIPSDFNNVCGISARNVLNAGRQNACTSHTSAQQPGGSEENKGVRHLSLCKPATPPKCHVADVLDHKPATRCNESNTEQRQMAEKAEQTDLDVDREDKSDDRTKKMQKKTKKKQQKETNRKRGDSSSEEESKCPPSCRYMQKYTKRRNKEHETSDSDC